MFDASKSMILNAVKKIYELMQEENQE